MIDRKKLFVVVGFDASRDVNFATFTRRLLSHGGEMDRVCPGQAERPGESG